jgi:hypothetical protein
MLRFITLGVALSSFRRRDLNMYAVEPIHAFDLAGQAREIALVDKDVAVPNRL